METKSTNNRVRAAISHYVAKRDKALAELEIYLTNPVGVGEHPHVTDEIIKLFEEVDSANSVLETIETVVNTSSTKEDLEQMIHSIQGGDESEK